MFGGVCAGGAYLFPVLPSVIKALNFDMDTKDEWDLAEIPLSRHVGVCYSFEGTLW